MVSGFSRNNGVSRGRRDARSPICAVYIRFYPDGTSSFGASWPLSPYFSRLFCLEAPISPPCAHFGRRRRSPPCPGEPPDFALRIARYSPCGTPLDGQSAKRSPRLAATPRQRGVPTPLGHVGRIHRLPDPRCLGRGPPPPSNRAPRSPHPTRRRRPRRRRLGRRRHREPDLTPQRHHPQGRSPRRRLRPPRDGLPHHAGRPAPTRRLSPLCRLR